MQAIVGSSSGWNVVAMTAPARTNTALSPTAASTCTPAPVRSMIGARMNVAWNGASRPSTSISVSNESIWRPYPLRRTSMSSARSRVGRRARRDVARQHDGSGARAERWHAGGEPLGDRLEQTRGDGQLRHGGRLATGDHERVDTVEVLRLPDRDRAGPEAFQHALMSSEGALECSTPIINDGRRPPARHGRFAPY
jgi:hypothetical protein